MGPIGAPAPGLTNVVILSRIPEGATEQQISAAAGRPDELLQVSFRPADPEGPGWAIVAFATPEIAKVARDRLDGKPLLGANVDAALGEGLFGKVRSTNDQDSPWKEARTKEGQVYYYHAVTRQTTWVKPPPEFPSAAQMMVGRSLPSRTANPGAQAQAAIRQAQDAIAAAHGSDPTGSTTSGPVGANLFVYHIPNSWDDHILRQHFEHFGKILSCRVQKDDSGRPRGFGFVSFDAPASAQAAIAGMHGFPVEGKWLKVQLKKGDEQQMEQAKEQVGGMPGMTVNQAAPPPPAPPPPAPPPPRDMGKSQGGDKGKKGFGKGDVGKPFGDGKGFGGFGDGKGFDASGKGFDGKGKGFDGKGLDSFDPKGFGKGNFMGNFPRPGPY